jgi:hypothetical protein
LTNFVKSWLVGNSIWPTQPIQGHKKCLQPNLDHYKRFSWYFFEIWPAKLLLNGLNLAANTSCALELVELVELVTGWSSRSKVGQAGQKLTNLVKLVKNLSSWSQVDQKLDN